MENTYILNDIPGFDDILRSINNIPNNYYTVTEYSTKSNQKYKFVRYNKDILAADLIPSYGILRSVIINSDNQVVSFAPVKSLPADIFIQKYENF